MLSFSGLTIYNNYINYSIIKGGIKTLTFFLRQKIIVHRRPTKTLSLSNCLDFSLSIRTRLFSISLSFARCVLFPVSLVFSLTNVWKKKFFTMSLYCINIKLVLASSEFLESARNFDLLVYGTVKVFDMSVNV